MTLMEKMNIDKARGTNHEVKFAAGHTSLKLRAAGMEALLEPEAARALIGDCRQPDRGTRAAKSLYD
jgi:hypothetical protein